MIVACLLLLAAQSDVALRVYGQPIAAAEWFYSLLTDNFKAQGKNADLAFAKAPWD
jgi:hypothetical protein